MMSTPLSPIRFAQAKDMPSLKRFMKEVFGDQDYFINLFFHYKVKENVLIYEINAHIVSMVYLLPATIKIADTCYPITYLYACATQPIFRGKGYMQLLLDEAFQIACSRNETAVFLLPATPSLYNFYEKNKFSSFFYKKTTHYTMQEYRNLHSDIATFELIDGRAYFLYRNQLLTHSHSIYWEEEHFVLLEKSMYKKEAGFFKITTQEGNIAIGFFSIFENSLTVSELIGDAIRKESIVSFLFQHYRIKKIRIEEAGDSEKSGMIQINPIYSHLFENRHGYFAFGLE